MDLTTRIFLSQLIFLYATRIYASVELAQFDAIFFEEENNMMEFSTSETDYLPDYPTIYRDETNEQLRIYELWALHRNSLNKQMVFQFCITEIPTLTPTLLVLEGVLLANSLSVTLHCKSTSIHGAQKIYQNYKPDREGQSPLFQLRALWNVTGINPLNPKGLLLRQLTNEVLGIFIDFLPPDNSKHIYAVESLQENKPYLVFTSSKFAALTSQGDTTKVFLVLEELRGNDYLNQYYGLELENNEGEVFLQIIQDEIETRLDLRHKMIVKYYSHLMQNKSGGSGSTGTGSSGSGSV